jgi:penicillin amidase
MKSAAAWFPVIAFLWMSSGCGSDDASSDASTATDVVDAADAADVPLPGDPSAQALIESVPLTATYTLPGLSAPVQVVRTEGSVPHIYAANRKDLAHAQGFVVARDRYFQLDLERRVGLGVLSELLGAAALSTDQGSRGNGSRAYAERVLARLTPDQVETFDAFAAGVNDYIALVVAGKLPEPTEILLAKGLLGTTAQKLMVPFDRRSVAGITAAVVYNLGYETDDIGRTLAAAALPNLFDGKALADLRKSGAVKDIWKNVRPVGMVSSALGLGLDQDGKMVPPPPPPQRGPGQGRQAGRTRAQAGVGDPALGVPTSVLQRLQHRADAWQNRAGRDHLAGWGSNAWAVAGKAAVGGRAMLAGDGHLPLTVPSLFYQIGLDTQVFGGGDTHQLGLVIPGLPILAVGTNGQVAWSQTQLGGDISDWYREELVLDASGQPQATRFGSETKPLKKIDEVFVVADVPLLKSTGRTETWARWETWDGRLIAEIEGRTATADEKLAPGESLVSVQGGLVVPGDLNNDGVVTAISGDFAGFDGADVLGAVDRFGHSKDVFEYREATKGLVAYSQNLTVADSQGHVLYTGYQAVPCRGYLPRDKDGVWLPGADPKQLLDGKKYAGFTIPVGADGKVDEAPGALDPYKCVVPFAEYPQSIDPPQGYVVTANNDPGNLASDNSLTNDKWYIGGPWANGLRALTISQELQKAIAAGQADPDRMSAIQANHRSRLGEEWAPFLIDAIQAAHKASLQAQVTPDEQRLVALYQQVTETTGASTFDAIEQRLQAWVDAGTPAQSGVETFYHTPAAQDAQHAVATMIFNAWFGAFVGGVFDDEGLPGIWEPWGNDARTRALTSMRKGRGPGNPEQLAAWNPDTEESAFFDVLQTPQVERSREVALKALVQAVTFLRAPPTGPGDGGFGTPDMSTWLWGLRHGVRFNSILADFLGDKPEYAFLTETFAITPEVVPLAPKLPKGDPRIGLPRFPRNGDAFVVDAAGGIQTQGFGYGSGPVFRMVIAPNGQDTTGWNILPGGQSSMTTSPHFADQAAMWLGNQAFPFRFGVKRVVEGATGREQLQP